MQNPQLLDNITHKDLRIITRRGAEWGDARMSCIATPDEFRRLQVHYPIVFQKNDQGSMQPLALFGLQEGQNLFLGPEGWTVPYVPLAMQREPFMIGVNEDELRMLVDMASPRISQGAEGEAVFLPLGGTSEFLEHANSVLKTLHEGLQATPAFIDALLAHELLEPFVLDVERPDGSHGRLVGLYTIHEERLAALDEKTVGLLHQADYLMPIYMAVASLSHLHTLIRLQLASEA
ncbi:SapC family protein [Roseateles albus]|uniref:SapC family protein n=1 Tax=Roseateles albus TaxID=2987525 RepID=A0ABT5KHK8_9BURK|nr:SapC family protein [Roseateles albus]MDC8773426.1 SapC family protein [Roseateles albus]